jgi:hypothetical protein
MTIINNTHKFIFIHIPKNAGTTINTLLSHYTYWIDVELGGTVHGEALAPLYLKRFGIGKHTRANQVRNLVGERIWENYFKFAFVRNPYARAFSVYRFLKQWRNWEGSAAMAKFATFEDFLLSDMFKNNPGPDSIFLPQHTWIEDINGNSLLDFIGSVEKIGRSLNVIADRIGIKLDSNSVPVKNDSGDPDEFRRSYSAAAIDIVRQRYKRDFFLFGYSTDLGSAVEEAIVT